MSAYEPSDVAVEAAARAMCDQQGINHGYIDEETPKAHAALCAAVPIELSRALDEIERLRIVLAVRSRVLDRSRANTRKLLARLGNSLGSDQ